MKSAAKKSRRRAYQTHGITSFAELARQMPATRPITAGDMPRLRREAERICSMRPFFAL